MRESNKEIILEVLPNMNLNDLKIIRDRLVQPSGFVRKLQIETPKEMRIEFARMLERQMKR